MFLQVEKGETCRFRLPNPEGLASSLDISTALANLAKTAKKILKSLERIPIINFRNKFKQFLRHNNFYLSGSCL